MDQDPVLPCQRDRNDRHCDNGIRRNSEFAALFVPPEGVPRAMTATMRDLDCHDNPVRAHFEPICSRSRQAPEQRQSCPVIGSLAGTMTSSLIITIIGVFAASVFRGFTGFGFGLAAVPLLGLALPPAQVVPFVTVLQVLVGLSGLRS